MTLERTYGWCRDCGMYDNDHAGVYKANLVTSDGVLMVELCLRCFREDSRDQPAELMGEYGGDSVEVTADYDEACS